MNFADATVLWPRSFCLRWVASLAWAAAPCVGAKPGANGGLRCRGGPSRSLVYSTYSLDERNSGITRAPDRD
jgi:hypothetical protein